ESRRQLADALKETEQARQEAVAKHELARFYQYYHNIALANAGWQANDLAQMGDLLEDCPAERRHWEWYYLQRLRHGDLLPIRLRSSAVQGVAFSPDGTRLAACGLHGMVKVLDAATGREVRSLKGHGDSQLWCVAFSPNGARLASAGNDGQIKIWDLAS